MLDSSQVATLAFAELCFIMQFLQWNESLKELNKFMLWSAEDFGKFVW